MVNQAVLNGLNPARKVADVYAYLIDDLNKTVFVFLYNPEEKRFSRQSIYNEGITALTSTPSQQYNYTTGRTLNLSNLLLESYSSGKTCKLLLDRLQALMVANPSNRKFNLSPVYFKWGADTFGPAVITDLNWNETSWLNGQVASARVNLTLLEIPPSQLPNKALIESSDNRQQAAQNTSKVVTDRQKQDATSKTRAWLNQNVKKMSISTGNLVRSNKYKLNISSQGVITLLDSKSKLIGTVGTYKDGKIDHTKEDIAFENRI
ncbi:hypothetical protein Nos7524_3210 [Nostoc sp. PCC 7524]|uniref:hypothetical protein n=1 Tax=Nostoc sp. (strain ATCC 29411 / PCC 7524) TaxID=28072 RepID=UPI00029F37DD|nr:hypothetical protein [Nostoc sp. PCC 7524]AFY49010.1 hypothetical protein Nos7524_3210 [Nostoc sp. PCC 7524]